MTTPNSATTIDKAYLTTLATTLQDLLNEVNTQAKGGTSGVIVNGQLGSGLASGGSGFDIAAKLNTALSTMGGTVADEIAWLQKVLTDMLAEINTTITTFATTDGQNTDLSQTLMQDLQSTLSDIQAPAVSSGSGSGSGSGSSSSSGT